MNRRQKDKNQDKTIWPPPPERLAIPSLHPNQMDRYSWVLFTMFATLVMSLSIGFAAYHFHLAHIIRAAHKEPQFSLGLDFLQCLVVFIVLVNVFRRVLWQAKGRHI
jgi:hypothetical protein